MPKSRRNRPINNPAPEFEAPTATMPVTAPAVALGNGDAAVLNPVILETPAPEYSLTTNPQLTLRTLSDKLTLEVLVYVALVAIGLILRTVLLDARPLAPSETQTAAAAWGFLNGQPVGAYTSPLLFTLDWLAFLLFGAFDLTARVFPAMLASLLILLPALARKALGQTGALVAAALIAFSPVLVYFARALSASDLAVGAALAALLLFWRYHEMASLRALYAAAILAGLALTADATAYMVIGAGALYFVVAWLWARRNGGEATKLAVEETAADDESSRPKWMRSPLVRAGVLFAATFILSATTFLLNRDGLGVAFNLLGTWLGSFSAFGPLTSPLNLLLVYEPLPLIFGLAGLVLAVTLRKDEGDSVEVLRLLSVLAVVTLLWYSIAGVKVPSNVVAIALPLMLLAGWFIGNLFERAAEDIRSSGGWHSMLTGELPVLIMLMVLTALIYLQVVGFLQQTSFAPALDVIYRLLGGSDNTSIIAAAGALGLITLLLLGIFVGLSILLVGAGRTMTLLAFIILVILSLGSLHSLLALSFSYDEPQRELVAGTQTTLQMRDVVKDLEFFSEWHDGDPHVIRIAADAGLGSAAHWYLRTFPNVTWTKNLAQVTDAEAIVAPADTPPPGNWRGQRYRYLVDWLPTDLNGIDLWKWFMFRTGGDENWQATMLWLPSDTTNPNPIPPQ